MKILFSTPLVIPVFIIAIPWVATGLPASRGRKSVTKEATPTPSSSGLVNVIAEPHPSPIQRTSTRIPYGTGPRRVRDADKMRIAMLLRVERKSKLGKQLKDLYVDEEKKERLPPEFKFMSRNQHQRRRKKWLSLPLRSRIPKQYQNIDAIVLKMAYDLRRIDANKGMTLDESLAIAEVIDKANDDARIRRLKGINDAAPTLPENFPIMQAGSVSVNHSKSILAMSDKQKSPISAVAHSSSIMAGEEAKQKSTKVEERIPSKGLNIDLNQLPALE